MYRKFLWIVAAVFSLVLSQSAFSDSDSGCGEGMSKMLHSLNLNDEQKAKIKPILDQQQTTMKDLSTQMNDVDTQIDKQLNSDKPDQSALDSLIEKKAQILGSMVKSKFSTKLQIFTLLTPEQKTKLHEKMKKLEDKIAAKFKNCHKDD